jgi:hypothetical protein
VKRRKNTCRKLRIFKHGREFRSERSKHYKLWAPPRRQLFVACKGSYENLGISLCIFTSIYPCCIILVTSNTFLLPFYAIPSPPSSFLSYFINPYSSAGKRWHLQRQWPWQQLHESIASSFVVGHADLAFRDHGAKATCPPQNAKYGRKTHSRKTKHDASKTLDEWTKSNATPLERCKLDIRSTRNNLWVRWDILIGISLFLLHHPLAEGLMPPPTRSATTV